MSVSEGEGEGKGCVGAVAEGARGIVMATRGGKMNETFCMREGGREGEEGMFCGGVQNSHDQN